MTPNAPARLACSPRRAGGLCLGILAILYIVVSLCACSEPPADSRLPVVATFSILGDVVQQVGGERIALTTLVGPDSDTHTYEPTPADATQVARAKIVFANGLGLETWIDRLYHAAGCKGPLVFTAGKVAPRTLIDNGHQETDPHCWQNVQNVMLLTQAVCDALSKADPAGANAYHAHADAYLKRLGELDDYIAQQTDTLPKSDRKLVTSHDSIGYFADRYGYALIGRAMASLSTESAEPSAKDVAAIIQEVREARVPAVFTENMHNAKLTQVIARDANVKIITSLYTDALGPAGSPGGTYIDMMRSNIDTIVKALKR